MDEFCEVKELLRNSGLITDWFWDLDQHEIIPNAVYVFSRQQFNKHTAKIKELAQAGSIFPILGNPAEGSETMLNQSSALGILDLVRQGKIAIIAGGEMQPDIPILFYENFLPKILNYQENITAIQQYHQQWSQNRPYKFLFLNGRARLHRRRLLSRLSHLLDQSIWTNLDTTHGNELKLLDSKYEFDFYKKNVDLEYSGFAKYNLFNNDWGEIYLNASPYLDTYFSLVTETVFDYPYSFRTEKIWKPIAMAHPWIAVANQGFYKDMHNLGFQTFGMLIDESFDSIENSADRLERIAMVVEDLCQQDLATFAKECYTVCKYNQQHLEQLSLEIPKDFPNQFQHFINERFRI
jgi:hypothetical protein